MENIKEFFEATGFTWLILFISLGIFYLVVHYVYIGIKVEAEYISGFLTAFSILFGFWVILIFREPRDRIEEWYQKNPYRTGFFFCLFSLIISIFLIFCSALNIIHPAFTLLFLMIFLLLIVLLLPLLYIIDFNKRT